MQVEGSGVRMLFPLRGYRSFSVGRMVTYAYGQPPGFNGNVLEDRSKAVLV